MKNNGSQRWIHASREYPCPLCGSERTGGAQYCSFIQDERGTLVHCANTPSNTPPEDWRYLKNDKSGTPLFTNAAQVSSRHPALGLTLTEYATAKVFDLALLRDRFGLTDDMYELGRVRTCPAVMMPYHDHVGRVVGTRFRLTIRKAKPDHRFRWSKGTRAAKLVYGYRTATKYQNPPRVLLGEGESFIHAAEHHGLPALGLPGKKMDPVALADAVMKLPGPPPETLIICDPDADGLAGRIAGRLRQCGYTGTIRAVTPQQVTGDKDLSDIHSRHAADSIDGAEAFAADLQKLLDAAQAVPEQAQSPGTTEAKAPASGNESKTQAEMLIELAEEAELFHDPAGDAFASVPVGNHQENYRVAAQGFRRWLLRRFYEEYRKAPSSEPLQSALGLIAAKAQFDGPQQIVAVRLAEHKGSVLLDLADEEWRAVEIMAAGRQVISKPPVRFIRPFGMLALPTPEPGGSVLDLRPFVNVADEGDFVLVVSWLLAALSPTGPYPLLSLTGEQGCGKSILSRLLRMLVDPNTAPLRAEPKEPRDLMITAGNSWLIAFDNLSRVQAWLSDALCRLATGGGFACRKLYSDSEEALFDSKRPILLNGIGDDLVSRSDLLDRALPVTLSVIPEEKRMPERELDSQFNAVRPRILGALLDAVSAGLKHRDGVKLDRLPRMADFAVWATACEFGLPGMPGRFLAAYTNSREAANATALETSPVGAAVVKFMENRTTWTGSASDLCDDSDGIAANADEKTKKLDNWPKSPRGMVNALTRLAPNLRRVGINFRHGVRTGKARILFLEKVGAAPSFASLPSLTPESSGLSSDEAVTQQHSSDATSSLLSSPEKPGNSGLYDGSDGSDDTPPTLSGDHQREVLVL